MSLPTCFRCHRELVDEHVKLMVDYSTFMESPQRIAWLRPYCVQCVKDVDQYEDGKHSLHEMWSLEHLREMPFLRLSHMLSEITSSKIDETQGTIWETEAINNFMDLLLLSVPKPVALELLKGFKDWDLESDQARSIRANRYATPEQEIRMRRSSKWKPAERRYYHTLQENEVELLLTKLNDLYFTTRGLISPIDYIDPANANLSPDFLRVIEAEMRELRKYYMQEFRPEKLKPFERFSDLEEVKDQPPDFLDSHGE